MGWSIRNEGRYRRDKIIILRMSENAFYYYERFNVQFQIRVSQRSKQSINRNFYSTIYVALLKGQVYLTKVDDQLQVTK